KQAQVLSVKRSSRAVNAASGAQVLRSIPRYILEDAPPAGGTYQEVLYTDRAMPAALKAFKNGEKFTFTGQTEVRVLVEQGPKENRINLPIVGDGYTLAEKEKFFTDAARIKDELFANEAYTSYLPLFNVYAVFVESKESGLTDGAHTVDTALGLYRSPAGS